MNHYITSPLESIPLSSIQLSSRDTSEAAWCVIRQLPTLQSIIVARFLSRIEAETYLVFMKRLYPNSFFEIMFDAP